MAISTHEITLFVVFRKCSWWRCRRLAARPMSPGGSEPRRALWNSPQRQAPHQVRSGVIFKNARIHMEDQERPASRAKACQRTEAQQQSKPFHKLTKSCNLHSFSETKPTDITCDVRRSDRAHIISALFGIYTEHTEKHRLAPVGSCM